MKHLLINMYRQILNYFKQNSDKHDIMIHSTEEVLKTEVIVEPLKEQYKTFIEVYPECEGLVGGDLTAVPRVKVHLNDNNYLSDKNELVNFNEMDYYSTRQFMRVHHIKPLILRVFEDIMNNFESWTEYSTTELLRDCTFKELIQPYYYTCETYGFLKAGIVVKYFKNVFGGGVVSIAVDGTELKVSQPEGDLLKLAYSKHKRNIENEQKCFNKKQENELLEKVDNLVAKILQQENTK